MFPRQLAVIPIALALISIPVRGDRRSGAPHQRIMALRDIGEIDGKLAVMLGVFGPSEFFRNLRSADFGDQTKLLSDAGEVRFFPDRMTITLSIVGPVPRQLGRIQSGFDPEYMKELGFSAQWKRGLELRPVRSFRQLTVSVARAATAIPVLGRESWTYEFVVEDTQVPVSDHLIFYIFSRDGKRLTRLSGYL